MRVEYDSPPREPARQKEKANTNGKVQSLCFDFCFSQVGIVHRTLPCPLLSPSDCFHPRLETPAPTERYSAAVTSRWNRDSTPAQLRTQRLMASVNKSSTSSVLRSSYYADKEFYSRYAREAYSCQPPGNSNRMRHSWHSKTTGK